MPRTQVRKLDYHTIIETYGVTWCTGENCPKNWGYTKHHIGSFDNYGLVHWLPKQRVTRGGLWRLLYLIGGIKLRHTVKSDKPEWQKIWERGTFAFREGMERFHIRFSSQIGMAERKRVLRLGGKAMRREKPLAYHWATWAIRQEEHRI